MYAALASQKRHMSLYLMSVYGDPGLAAWFTVANILLNLDETITKG